MSFRRLLTRQRKNLKGILPTLRSDIVFQLQPPSKTYPPPPPTRPPRESISSRFSVVFDSTPWEGVGGGGGSVPEGGCS